MWLTAFQSNLNKPGSWPEYGLSCSVETELKLLGKAFISTTAVFSIYLPFPAISKKVNATECKQREKRKNAALSQWTLTLKYTSAEKYSIFFFSTGLHSWYRKGKKTGEKKQAAECKCHTDKENCHIYRLPLRRASNQSSTVYKVHASQEVGLKSYTCWALTFISTHFTRQLHSNSLSGSVVSRAVSSFKSNVWTSDEQGCTPTGKIMCEETGLLCCTSVCSGLLVLLVWNWNKCHSRLRDLKRRPPRHRKPRLSTKNPRPIDFFSYPLRHYKGQPAQTNKATVAPEGPLSCVGSTVPPILPHKGPTYT